MDAWNNGAMLYVMTLESKLSMWACFLWVWGRGGACSFAFPWDHFLLSSGLLCFPSVCSFSLGRCWEVPAFKCLSFLSVCTLSSMSGVKTLTSAQSRNPSAIGLTMDEGQHCWVSCGDQDFLLRALAFVYRTISNLRCESRVGVERRRVWPGFFISKLILNH